MQRCDTCEHCSTKTNSMDPKGFIHWCGCSTPYWDENEGREVPADGGRWCDCWNEKA